MNLAIEGDLPTKSVGLVALNQLGDSKLLALEEEQFLFEVGGAVQELVLDSTAQEAETRRTKRWRRP